MKKIFSAFISICIILTFAVTICAEGFSEDMQWLYSVNTDGATATITVGTMAVSQNSGNIEIPTEIDGYTVTGIGTRCFLEEPSLFTVFIPHTVTAVGDYAFQRCYGLNTVTMESGVKSIGNYSFSNCYGLYNVILSDELVSIGDGAFESCSGLSEISIPYGTQVIGSRAFAGCAALQMVFIPESVTVLGDDIFDGCTSMLTVYYEGTATQWAKVKKNEADFSGVNLNINGVSAGSGTQLPDYVPYGEYNGFSYKFKTDGTVAINGYQGSDREYIEIPSEIEGCPVTSIADSTFRYFRDIKEVFIPDSVVSIGEFAFDNCSRLEKVTMSKNVTEIGEYAFANCNHLERIEIPQGVTVIENSLFYNDYCLEEIVIPHSVTKIKRRAFSACSELEIIYYTGSEQQWNSIDTEAENRYAQKATVVYNYNPETYKPAGATVAIILCCVAVLVPVVVIIIVATHKKPKCPDCGHELDGNPKFCTQCGKEL